MVQPQEFNTCLEYTGELLYCQEDWSWEVLNCIQGLPQEAQAVRNQGIGSTGTTTLFEGNKDIAKFTKREKHCQVIRFDYGSNVWCLLVCFRVG